MTVDGMGNDATVMATCTSCHLAAGSDAAHTPSPGGRDEVYTPVD
jgi:cytochrome c553